MTTTQQAPASGSRIGAGPASLPRASSRGAAGTAPIKNNNYQLLQVVLFWAGAVLMPLGIVVIILGWYGAANTPFGYDQTSYLISGGVLGLGLTFVGGFLYFGAWLARMTNDAREASSRLSDTLLVLADVTSRAASVSGPAEDVASLPVRAGNNSTIHRRDCQLIAHREDLAPVGDTTGLVACRVCTP